MVAGSGLLERTKTKWPCSTRWSSARIICDRARVVRAPGGVLVSTGAELSLRGNAVSLSL